MLGDLPEVKEVGKWQNWTLNTIYLDSVWIPILCTTSTIPLVLCCQCGGDSTLIWKVPVKRSPCHLHHSSADALSPVMWLGPTQAVQWDSPLKWWSVFMQVVSSAIVIQKFIIFERRLGKSCLQWNVMLIRPRWLGFSHVFHLTTWCEEARLGRDRFVQLKEALGVRMSCYQIPEQWLLLVMCGPCRLLDTAWL